MEWFARPLSSRGWRNGKQNRAALWGSGGAGFRGVGPAFHQRGNWTRARSSRTLTPWWWPSWSLGDTPAGGPARPAFVSGLQLLFNVTESLEPYLLQTRRLPSQGHPSPLMAADHQDGRGLWEALGTWQHWRGGQAVSLALPTCHPAAFRRAELCYHSVLIGVCSNCSAAVSRCWPATSVLEPGAGGGPDGPNLRL